MSTDVVRSWSRYEAWLQQQHPSLLDMLRPPAPDSKLRRLEEALGQPLPSDVISLWKLHDGQFDEMPGLIAGFQFLSVEMALNEWRMWADLRAAHDARQLKQLGGLASSLPRGAIQRVYTCAGWVPLWKEPMEGNYLGVDLTPGEHGTPGQVINFGRDEDDKVVLAPDLAEALEWLVTEVEATRVFMGEQVVRPGMSPLYLSHAKGRFLSVFAGAARKRFISVK